MIQPQFLSRRDFIVGLMRIPGVKDATLEETGVGQILVHVRYKFLTRIVRRWRQRAQNEVYKLIYNHKPYGVSMDVKEGGGPTYGDSPVQRMRRWMR